MKKIPTLFVRRFENHRVVEVLDWVTPGMEWVLEGEGEATVKLDGSCCAIIDGIFYKRYDCKAGKKVTFCGKHEAIPCCEPDPVTGHWPWWVRVDPQNPSDKWFCEAFRNSICLMDGTYEAIGPHFQGNPHRWKHDELIRHGTMRVNVHRSYEGIREYLRNNVVEGLVFWKDGEPQCKIKRSDFGFEWPVEEGR